MPNPTRRLRHGNYQRIEASFFRRAEEIPNRIAVQGSDGRWTYGDVGATAQALAGRLRDAGIERGDSVAVLARREPWLVWALLGVLRAGASFVILDMLYPSERIASQVSAAAPKVILASGQDLGWASAISNTLRGSAVLEVDPVARGGVHSMAVAPQADSNDPAYIAFTSGTTRAPLAILGTHSPVTHFLGWYTHSFGLTAHDRFALLAGLSHDPLLRDLFAPLSLGAVVAIPDVRVWSNPLSLHAWLREERTSVIHLTPALGAALVSAQPSGGELRDLRLACFAGDMLRSSLVRAFRDMAPDATVVNFYGTTETPQTVAFSVVANESNLPAVIPIGRGIEDVQLLLMLENRVARSGEEAEVCVRTPHLSRGYLGNEELTRERFVPNPFTGDESDLMYRTGDKGFYDELGNVTLTGRIDRQLKIAGTRVELGEVEGWLLAAGLKQAAVVPAIRTKEGISLSQTAPDGADAVLVAYVVGDGPVSADELRGYLAQRLPPAAVPGWIMQVNALPLTPNLKIDREALPPPTAFSSQSGGSVPEGIVERTIERLWREALLVPTVDSKSNFFDLGGDSLAAIQLTLALQEYFRREVTIDLIFDRPTIALQAEFFSAMEEPTSVGDDGQPGDGSSGP